jgi:hypothetical protein
MALNTQYINATIDSFERTCFLTKRIHLECTEYIQIGSYAPTKRSYLGTSELKSMLKKNGYSQFLTNKLVTFTQESVGHAYNRGVFVVSSRVIGLSNKQVSIDSPEALLSYLRNKEKEYFDPILWYRNGTFTRALLKEGYCNDQACEVGGFILRHVRTAFAVGMKTAAKKVI